MTMMMIDVECLRLILMYRGLKCGLVFSLAESILNIQDVA